MPSERWPSYDDERMASIDEQICALLKQRKELSGEPALLPSPEKITAWSEKYDLYEDYLHSIFAVARRPSSFRPRIQPENFRKYIPILRSLERDGVMYTLSFIRQYQNASVVQLLLDYESMPNVEIHKRLPHPFFELEVGAPYAAVNSGGGGSAHHYSFAFAVFPALPDDLASQRFVFKKLNSPDGDPTGEEVVFDISSIRSSVTERGAIT